VSRALALPLHLPVARTSLPIAFNRLTVVIWLQGCPTLEIVCIRFFDILATVRCLVKRIYAALRVKCGNGDWVVFVDRLVKLCSERTNLLHRLWIGRLLGKARHGKVDCQSY
jgi:hypothetical protein